MVSLPLVAKGDSICITANTDGSVLTLPMEGLDRQEGASSGEAVYLASSRHGDRCVDGWCEGRGRCRLGGTVAPMPALYTYVPGS
jgi:hypothetical protein